MNHIEFLDFAKSLPTQDEINLRNAISRAYYAAYHDCLLQYQVSFTITGGVHANLIETMKKSTDVRDRQIGEMLKILRGQRTMADYKLQFNVNDRDRDTAIQGAEAIMLAIKTRFNMV